MEIQVLFFFLIGGIWLAVLSFFVFRINALFNKLTKGVEVADLKKVLERLLENESKNADVLKDIEKKIAFLNEEGKYHVQKIGLVRFNPFKELGGDHSFSLAILDGLENGIIITSLHTRDRTRVYMKNIKKGKPDTDLSEDERKALSVAIKK